MMDNLEQMVKRMYLKAIIGPSVNIKLKRFSSQSLFSPVELCIDKMTKGWEVLADEKHYKVLTDTHNNIY